MSDRPLTVVISDTGIEKIAELHFICDVLFSEIRRPIKYHVFNRSSPLVQNDVLIINLANEFNDLIDYYTSMGCVNTGVFTICHTSGEDRHYYRDVDYVIRFFYDSRANDAAQNGRCMDVLWVPNGYSTGIGPRAPSSLLSFADRHIEYAFRGALNTSFAERPMMISAINEHSLAVDLQLTPGFRQGLYPQMYRVLTENTRFGLAPSGTDAETIRLFECMELGCIPISLPHNFLMKDDAMKDCPIIYLTGWQHLKAFMAEFGSNSDCVNECENLRQIMVNWWSVFKKNKALSVAKLVEASFSRYY